MEIIAKLTTAVDSKTGCGQQSTLRHKKWKKCEWLAPDGYESRTCVAYPVWDSVYNWSRTSIMKGTLTQVGETVGI